MTTPLTGGRRAAPGTPAADGIFRRRRALARLVVLLALVPLCLLFLAFRQNGLASSDFAAAGQCEDFAGDSLEVYAATHNHAVSQALADVRTSVNAQASAALASQPPAPADPSSPDAPAPPGQGVSPSPASGVVPLQNTAQMLGSINVEDTAGTDWPVALRAMARAQSSLAAAYPQGARATLDAWNAFNAQLRDTGSVDWRTTRTLHSATQTAARALRADAAQQRQSAAALAALSVFVLLGALAAFRDGLRKLREAEERLDEERREREALLESTGEGICALDRQGVCTYVNRAAAEMLGYSPHELVGKNFHALIRHSRADGTSLPPEEDLFLHALQTGTAFRRNDDIVWRRDGTPLPVDYTCAPIQAGVSVRGAVVAFSDIMERKELETLRDDLNGMIVHDLRTPMTSLLTGLQTLAMIGRLDERQQEFLEIAVQGGQTLLDMVNDLLDISKMEAGSLKLRPEAVNPADLLALAMRHVAPLAGQNGLKIARNIAPALPTLTADGDLVRRALVNLLGNAVKFTPRGGIVTVAAFHDEAEKAVVFAVGDTGEGIPAHALQRIFDKFGQVETRKSGHKMSTGLGLTFCKLVAEAHGGRIWVESKLGKGSRFLFTIPLQPAPKLLPPATSLPASIN